MRQFIVLGFATNSKTDSGESLYLGSDRGQALEIAGEQTEQYCRKEIYELATPMVRRHFAAAPETVAE